MWSYVSAVCIALIAVRVTLDKTNRSSNVAVFIGTAYNCVHASAGFTTFVWWFIWALLLLANIATLCIELTVVREPDGKTKVTDEYVLRFDAEGKQTKND